LRIERWLRWLVYATAVALFVTGVAWWCLADASGSLRFYLMAAHGLGAMLFLVLLGAVIVLHVRTGWQRKSNRLSGTIVLGFVTALSLTAFGLYYIGSEMIRDVTSTLHLGLGLLLPILLAAHVVIGVRARSSMDDSVD
jgi:hypothetical protein